MPCSHILSLFSGLDQPATEQFESDWVSARDGQHAAGLQQPNNREQPDSHAAPDVTGRHLHAIAEILQSDHSE